MDFAITVRREQCGATCTLGSLYLGADWECFTLEDPVRADPDPSTPANEGKVYGETAIPPGRYRLVLSPSPRLKIVTPELLDVPGYAGIRIHVANTAREVLGCIAVGKGRESGRVTRSQVAFDEIMRKLSERKLLGDRMWCAVE